MTQLITHISDWQMIRKSVPMPLGFVPTMGNLHTGHATLLQRACQDNACTVLSIFINPTQFNDTSDFERYPRTLEADLKLAQELGVTYVLAPAANELYPNGYRYLVRECELAHHMEGQHRPGHFDGMLTIVMKLLMLVCPTRAYFGEKDFQQLQLVQGLVHDFFLPIEIVPMPIWRESNGLAGSSRNQRLSPAGRQLAAQFYQALNSAADCTHIRNQLAQLGFHVEYIEEHQQRRFGAVVLEGVRLIDNVPLSQLTT